MAVAGISLIAVGAQVRSGGFLVVPCLAVAAGAGEVSPAGAIAAAVGVAAAIAEAASAVSAAATLAAAEAAEVGELEIRDQLIRD